MSNRIALLAYMAMLPLMDVTAAETHSNVDAINTLCLEIDFVERVAADFEQRIQDAENKLRTLETEVKTFELAAACTTGTEEALRLHALSAVAKKRADTARHDLDAKKKQLQESARILRSRAAQLKAFEALWPGTPTYSGATFEAAAYTTATRNSAHKGCSINVETAQQTANTCQTKLGPSPKSGAAAAELASLTYIHALSDNKFKTPTIKVGIAAEGNVGASLAGRTTDSKACGETSDGTAASLAAATTGLGIAAYEPPAVQPTPTKQALKKGLGSDNQCEEPDKPDNKLIVTTKHLANAICKAQNTKIDSPGLLSATQVADLIAETDVQDIIIALLTSAGKSDDKTKDKKEAAKSLLGDDKKTVEDKFIKKLEQNKPGFKVGTAANTKNLKDLATDQDFSLALAFCKGRESQATIKAQAASPTIPENQEEPGKAAGQNKNDDNKTNAAECKGTEEGKCDKTKCTWNKEKSEYKVKEEAFISVVLNAPPFPEFCSYHHRRLRIFCSIL
uniref:Variant surface glycoprotein 1125.1021 n=1 Tax=Trypanosoma brucei TaxID=5691 RepID=A0A1J0R665_9TRYP|nr:variant surface glycoprotein 1125.1021 [Trypanosoma brucei]